MELTNRLPFVAHVDGCDDPADVIDAMLLGRFVAGELPFARSVTLPRVRPDAPLMPAGASPVREARSDGRHSRIAIGDEWALKSTRWSDGSGHLTVTAVTDELAECVLLDATADAVEADGAPGEAARVTFWHQGRCGG